MSGGLEGIGYTIGVGIAFGIFFAIRRWWQKFYYVDGKLDKLEEKMGVIGMISVIILIVLGIAFLFYLDHIRYFR
jgi:hypothetical protein